MFQLETNCARGEAQLAGHMDYGPERHSFERYRIPAAQSVQVDAVAVIRGDHGQACEPAFSGLRLMNDREMPARFEMQQRCHDHILTLSNGSRSQFINERFSRMMSARRSMSAC